MKKLNLSDLEVTSFVTETTEVKGGGVYPTLNGDVTCDEICPPEYTADTGGYCCVPQTCPPQCTNNGFTDFGCGHGQ